MGLLSKYWKEALSLLLIPLILGAETAYRHPLYSFSLEFIAEWQKSISSHRMVNFFRFVSFFGTETGLALLYGLVFCLCARNSFLKISLVFFVSQALYSFFKQFYHNPRPYFSSDAVRAVSCSKGYGNPSGHTVTAVAVYGSLWVLIYWERSKYLIPRRGIRIIIKILTCALVLALMGLTFFARMYLGSHSLNHVVFGSCLGMWVVFTFTIALRRYVDSHIEYVIKERNQFKFTAGAAIIIAVTVVLHSLNVALYFSVKDSKEFIDPDWLPRINAKCPNMLKDGATLMEESFKGIAHTTLYPLIYLSQLISSRMHPTVYENWHLSIGLTKTVIRTVLGAAILCMCEIPYLFVDTTRSLALYVCVGLLLPNCLITLVGLPTIDRLSVKMGLVADITPESVVVPDNQVQDIARDKSKVTGDVEQIVVLPEQQSKNSPKDEINTSKLDNENP